MVATPASSTDIEFRPDMSRTTPSQVDRPAKQCPPPRATSRSPAARAYLTAATTSDTDAQRTIERGCARCGAGRGVRQAVAYDGWLLVSNAPSRSAAKRASSVAISGTD